MLNDEIALLLSFFRSENQNQNRINETKKNEFIDWSIDLIVKKNGKTL